MSFHLYQAVYTTTILVVLTCTLNVSCQDTRDRVRLLRLKLLAVKMRAKAQALDYTDSYVSQRLTDIDTQRGSNYRKRNQHGQIDQAVNNFEKEYMKFHEHLTQFIYWLDNKYRQDLPFNQQKMIEVLKGIPQILPLNDDSFPYQDPKMLWLKWIDLSQAAQRFLNVLPTIIQPVYGPRISELISTLQSGLGWVAFYALQLFYVQQDIPKALQPGIGGANLSPPLPYFCYLCHNINKVLSVLEARKT